MTPRRTLLRLPVRLSAMALVLSLARCNGGDDGVNDELSAELAYLGLDRAVDRVIDLGFDGFNAADSANIPQQSEAGDLSGMMIVDGKVDQGASNNKNMTLSVTLQDGYADRVLEGEREVIYNGGPATVELSFKGLPTANFTGSLRGAFTMTGDLVGDVTLDLQLTGETEASTGDMIVRKAGTLHVFGTATSGYGVFDVDLML